MALSWCSPVLVLLLIVSPSRYEWRINRVLLRDCSMLWWFICWKCLRHHENPLPHRAFNFHFLNMQRNKCLIGSPKVNAREIIISYPIIIRSFANLFHQNFIERRISSRRSFATPVTATRLPNRREAKIKCFEFVAKIGFSTCQCLLTVVFRIYWRSPCQYLE